MLALPLILLIQINAVIAEVRIHGNAVTPDEEVLRLAAVKPGDAFDDTTIAAIEKRLRAAGGFKQVDVLKRFASISDSTQILVVIIVDDGPIKIEWNSKAGGTARTVRRRAPPWMMLPLLSAEDGYGVTYGMQFAIPDVAGERSRASFPLTWGGDKRAAVQLQKDFSRGPVPRLTAGLSVSRRRNPFFEEDDHRLALLLRGERDVVKHLRFGLTAGRERVSFAGAAVDDVWFDRLGGDIVFDTRLDPMLARNAVFVRAGLERVHVRGAAATDRRELEGRGYVGLPGQSVLVVRALREGANRPLPEYLQPLLGGMANLRGFKAGTAVGDTLVAGSLELRTPLTSPLSVGKLGVNVFADVGTVYGPASRLRDQTFRRGVGAGVWFSAALFRLNVAVAHGAGASTRVHVGSTLTF
jgi:outer membrane protein assembly factor BamA